MRFCNGIDKDCNIILRESVEYESKISQDWAWSTIINLILLRTLDYYRDSVILSSVAGSTSQ